MGLGSFCRTVVQVSRQWYEHPSLVLQLKALAGLRNDLRDHNLFEGDGIRPKDDLGEATEEVKRARTPDGTWNDLSEPWMGAKEPASDATFRRRKQSPIPSDCSTRTHG